MGNEIGSRDRRKWLIVVSLFITLSFVFGSGYNTGGVFIGPLIHEFGWTRTKASALQTVLALSSGLIVPLVGWLLDRIEARILIAVGAALVGIGFLLASMAHAFVPMVIAYVFIGLGIASATLLPASLVIPNWFDERRGLALAIVMSGTSLGGMIMTYIASQTIMASGWRMAYVVLAIPMFVVVVPLVFAFVRTRPRDSKVTSLADSAMELHGWEIRQAFRNRSFWLIASAQLFFTASITGINLHVVPYLTGAGFTPARAALVLSAVLGLAAVGKLAMGLIADRIGARIALSLDLAVMAVSALVLLYVLKAGMLIAFIVLYGLSWGAPTALFPMALAEVSGLKRLGSLLGILGISTMIGGTIGPILAGRIFDVTGRYDGVFYLFVIILLLGAAATLVSALTPSKAREPVPIA